MTTIDRKRVAALMERERATFRQRHARSGQLAAEATRSLLFGVPMNWMTRWPGEHPVYVDRAVGARFRDVDGNEFVDFCLGDTGGMAGHAPPIAVEAIANQARKGITLMLPTADAAWVGNELARRFAVPYWQFTLSATDANRCAIRWAREITQRPKIVVHNGCYHGTVDESVAALENGRTVARPGNIGKPVPLDLTTRVVEFNDLEGLEAALEDGAVAACLFEPALTNIGIVLPDPGYHEAARALCTKYGTLLIIDETHTISAGPGGCTKAWGLDPDIVTIGKTLGAGIASGAYGMTEPVRDLVYARTDARNSDVGGIGGTLAGNALSLAAMRATLSEVLTEEAFARMIPLAERWTEGVEAGIAESGLPWHVTRLGCRAEYLFGPDRPRNGAEAHAASDAALERYLHLFALNRGILLTPFHNMALMSPATSESDVDRHTEVFREAVLELARLTR
jgi:glutamate-1-semialdehyde aminotransferase